MSQHSGCANRREAVAGLVMGILPAPQAADLRLHLETCEACRRLHDSLKDQEEHLHAAFDQLGGALRAQSSANARTLPTIRLGRARISTQFVKATAAIAAAVAAAVCLTLLRAPDHPGGAPFSGVAQAASFSEVMRRIADARTVAFTKTVLYEGEDKAYVARQLVLQGGHMRAIDPEGGVSIYDFSTGDQVWISPDRTYAGRTHMVREQLDRLTNYVDWIRTLHEREAVHFGQEELAGRMVDVFKADRPYQKVTVWTDPKTNLPVRVEKVLLPCTDKDIRVPNMRLSEKDFVPDGFPDKDNYSGQARTLSYSGPGVMVRKQTVVWNQFDWNVDLDPSLFSLEVPPGCKVTERTNIGDAPVADVEALVAALRLWAETSDGRFPANINMLADSQPNLVRKYRGTDSPPEAYAQALKMANTILKGMSFAQECKLEDNWHYDGRNVTLGQTDRALAWWKNKKTGTWQVIYGDLTVQQAPSDRAPTSQLAPHPT